MFLSFLISEQVINFELYIGIKCGTIFSNQNAYSLTICKLVYQHVCCGFKLRKRQKCEYLLCMV